MKMRIFLFVSLLTCASLVWGQRTLEMDRTVVSQVRIDLRDLGYPPVDVIPSEESAIRALAVAPNGALYGATSGKRSHLFVLSPMHGYVVPLGFIKDATAIHRSLVISAAGDVYIGTSIGVDNNGEGYGTNYPGGRLLKYTPANDEAKPLRVDAPIQTTDLGIPIPNEGIYCLALDRGRDVIYGLSYPNGQFFSYDIGAQKFTVHGRVADRRMRGENFENEKNISRAIGLDRSGDVFVSGEGGNLYRFHAERLEKPNLTAPTVRGREEYCRVDAWAEDGSGILYGGTSDGYLFRLNPRSLKIENLGKPLNQYRIRGLVFAPNGKLYGAGGDDDEMARLFSYNPANGVYEMLGMIDVNRRPYYTWHAYVVDSMAVGLDGTVYIGQSERISRLYLYYPE